MGADKLLGNGDMLFLWPGTSRLLRGQGTYLSDDEINRVVDSVSTGEQNFVHELERGSATKLWLDICEPVMGTIIDGAMSMDLQGPVQMMVASFDRSLKIIQPFTDESLVW